MSTTQNTSQRCKRCDESYTHHYAPGYCSEDCYYSYKGSKALNLLRYDHRYCSSCGRVLKEIERPPTDKEIPISGPKDQPDENEVRNVLVGFQYRTPNAEIVEKEFQGVDEYSRLYATGTGCTCGVTDSSEPDSDLQNIELATVLSNYVKRFREIYDEGQIDNQLSKDVFFHAFKTSQDLEFALGKALYE